MHDEKLIEARIARVEEHVRNENMHDLEGIMKTLIDSPHYIDTSWNERHNGGDAVRAYYGELLRGMPDLNINVQKRYVTDDAIILNVIISGTHLGTYRGLPPSGKPVQFPLCGIFTFEGDRIVGEQIYYDRATVLHQLGVLFEPDTLIGRLVIALTHPVTMCLIGWHMINKFFSKKGSEKPKG